MIATMPGDRLDDQFIRLVDELVVSAGKDPELVRGLKWIDMQSRKNGISFYEMAFMVLKKHEAENRARQWLKNKESN
jgi:hypothetical protein